MQLNMRRSARRLRGLSLVELMVGIAVSLFVVAAATLLTSTQLSDNRRLLLETQLQQDLRATADIITRDLRRVGYWHEAVKGLPNEQNGGKVAPSPYAAIAITSSNSSVVQYRYRRPQPGGSYSEAFGFRLTADGVLQSCQSDGSEASGFCASGWQDLTDRNVMRVTEFRIAVERPGAGVSGNDEALVIPCPQACADGTASCWPKVSVREFTVHIEAESRNPPVVQRSLDTSVRVRNERVELSSEAPVELACPGV